MSCYTHKCKPSVEDQYFPYNIATKHKAGSGAELKNSDMPNMVEKTDCTGPQPNPVFLKGVHG